MSSSCTVPSEVYTPSHFFSLSYPRSGQTLSWGQEAQLSVSKGVLTLSNVNRSWEHLTRSVYQCDHSVDFMQSVLANAPGLQHCHMHLFNSLEKIMLSLVLTLLMNMNCSWFYKAADFSCNVRCFRKNLHMREMRLTERSARGPWATMPTITHNVKIMA